jgi:hypothetical protein
MFWLRKLYDDKVFFDFRHLPKIIGFSTQKHQKLPIKIEKTGSAVTHTVCKIFAPIFPK